MLRKNTNQTLTSYPFRISDPIWSQWILFQLYWINIYFHELNLFFHSRYTRHSKFWFWNCLHWVFSIVFNNTQMNWASSPSQILEVRNSIQLSLVSSHSNLGTQIYLDELHFKFTELRTHFYSKSRYPSKIRQISFNSEEGVVLPIPSPRKTIFQVCKSVIKSFLNSNKWLNYLSEFRHFPFSRAKRMAFEFTTSVFSTNCISITSNRMCTFTSKTLVKVKFEDWVTLLISGNWI